MSMNMIRSKSIWIALILLGVIGAEAAPYSFDRYQVILDRKPFGEPPPAPVVQAAPVIPAVAPSFARTLRLSMIIKEDTGDLKVGIVNLSDNSVLALHVGDIENGIELVSADYDEDEAVLRKGTEMALIKMTGAEATAINPNQPQARAASPSSSKLVSRRRSRRPSKIAARPVVAPKYTGEELKKTPSELPDGSYSAGAPAPPHSANSRSG